MSFSPEVHYKYPCDICGKKFTRPQHVTRHKLLHTGERPHTCPRDNCDKSFAREDKLKYHLIKGCPPELDQSLDSRFEKNFAFGNMKRKKTSCSGIAVTMAAQAG